MLIESKRVGLRDYQSNDLEAVFAFTGDAEVATHSSWGPLTKAETKNFLADAVESAKAKPRHTFQLAIVDKTKNEVIGNASLIFRNVENQEAEIGYTIRKDKWGKGFGTEAGELLLEFGFQKLKLHRIIATASPDNNASHSVLDKIGMREEGMLRKHVKMRGEWRDSILYACLEEDFE